MERVVGRVDRGFRQSIVALLPRLRAFARSLARDPSDADDLVQQTCEKALAARPDVGPGLDRWMFRVLRNQFIDTYRRRRPTVAVDDPMIADTLMGSDGRRVGDARLELRDVQAVIAELPEEQRSVLVLVCVDGLSYREVAEVMEIPIGTVMSRLSRARLAIAETLDARVVPLRARAGKEAEQ